MRAATTAATVDRPRVSIGLPVYNGQRYLVQSVESVLAQTYTDFELVISDNGSTDRTQELCEQWARNDSRVRYFRSDTNRGGTWNFNRVIELSRGELFRWVAHDDVMKPGYLAAVVAALDADPDAVLCHTRVEIIDEDGVSSGVYPCAPMRYQDPRPDVRFRDAATYADRLHMIFGVMRLDALRKIPPYGDYGHADGVLLAQLILLGTFIQLPEALQLMREHGEQASTTYGVKGSIDYLAWRAWFDPKYEGRLGFPYWRIVGELTRSLVVVPGVALRTRVRCLGGVWAAAWATKGRMRQDLVRARRVIAGRARARVTGAPAA